MRFEANGSFTEPARLVHANCSLSSPDGCDHVGGGSRTAGLQDTEDLVTCAKMLENFRSSNSWGRSSPDFHTSNNLDLGNTVGVTEDNTDLGRSGTLLGQLADVVDNLVGGGLEPGRGGARVGDGGGRNALSLAVKTTHFVFWFLVLTVVVDGCCWLR